MRGDIVNSQSIVPALMFLLLGSYPAHADRFDLAVGMEMGYTDNVNLTKDSQSDIPLEVFTTFRYADHSSTTEGLVEGRVAYRDYLKNHASDEWRPDVHGNLLWHLDPGRWSWALDGAWQQVRISQLGPASPANTENQATVWTGPDFRARLSSVTTVKAEARAGYQYNSETNDDNANFRAALSLSRELSDTVAVSGNFNARAVRYSKTDNDLGFPVFADFNIAEAFIGYSRQDSQITTLIDVGGSFADIKGAENQSDFLLRVDASRDLSAHSKAGLRVFYGFESEASTALIRSPLPDLEAPIAASEAGLFYEKRGEIYYDRSGKRSGLSGWLYARNRDFVGEGRDETTFGAEIVLSSRLTRRSEARLVGNVGHNKFDNLSGQDYQEYQVRAEVNHRVNRKASGTAELRYRRRVGGDLSLEYSEMAIFMSLTYQLKP